MTDLVEISRRFGKKAIELSVPGTKNGRQEIFVRFSNGESIRIESDSPEEAWAALWEEAPPTDAEGMDLIKRVAQELARQRGFGLDVNGEDLGEWQSFTQDAKDVIAIVRGEDPGIPVYRLKDGGDT